MNILFWFAVLGLYSVCSWGLAAWARGPEEDIFLQFAAQMIFAFYLIPLVVWLARFLRVCHNYEVTPAEIIRRIESGEIGWDEVTSFRDGKKYFYYCDDNSHETYEGKRCNYLRY